MKSKRRTFRFTKERFIRIFLFSLLMYFIFITIRSVLSSVFFLKRDRVDIVFYGERSSFVSVGMVDDVHYIGFFDNGANVYVPGGYGRYNIGALGRLSELEKNPRIIQKAFSSVLSAYVDFYFTPKKNPVYPFELNPLEEDFPIPRLALTDVFFSNRYYTNAGIIDRIFLYYRLKGLGRSDLSFVSADSATERDGERMFVEDRFERKYQGYFYQSFIRKERKEIQILYTEYKSALLVTRILEGEGIRIVDLSQLDRNEKGCIIHEDKEAASKTSLFLQQTFGCAWRRAEVDTADIALILGSELEAEWGE